MMDSESENDRFRLVIESAPNGIIVASDDGKIVLVNHRAEEMFGYSRKEFLALTVEDLVPQKTRTHHHKLRDGYHKTPEIRQMGAGRDLFATRKDGTEFPVEIGLTPMKEGEVTRVLSSVVDITERKLAEEKLSKYAQELAESNSKLTRQSNLLRNVHDAVILVDREGSVLEWNKGAARIFEMEADLAIGCSLRNICKHEGKHPFFDRILPILSTNDSANEIVSCKLKSGREIFLRVYASKMQISESEAYVLCASDITEQKKLEKEILNISEREQRRIGQDIHDDLCSQLSGISCLTKAMETTFRKNHEEEAQLMQRVTEMLGDAGEKARQIAQGLVPAALETMGISGALSELAEHSREVFGVNCVAKTGNTKQLDQCPEGAAVQLYRITQEAITNAIKHSDAEMIKVEANGSENAIELTIFDDGKGIPEDLVSAGLGLLTMRRRAEIIQAEFDIHSTPGVGTKIQCILPLFHE